MTMRKVSAAVLIAASSLIAVGGALAAAPTAAVTMGTKTDVPAFAVLHPMIGKWAPADLIALDTAKSIKVFDTKSLYSTADAQQVATAESSANANITSLRAAINANADLKAWFAAQKIDVNRVIGLKNQNGNVSVFLY
jgi:hypothetical protein